MTEIPEQYLEQAADHRLATLTHDMRLGENEDLLLREIQRILASPATADRDSIEDMTLADLIQRVCEAEVEQEMDNGDLDEDAMQIAIEDAESRYDRDMER